LRANIANKPADERKLRYQLRRMANFFRVNDGEAVLQDPPARLIEDMLAEPDAPLPTLRAITDVPIFASDGTLIAVPGYHPDSGIYYRPAPGPGGSVCVGATRRD
jgi:hypothetical protein